MKNVSLFLLCLVMFNGFAQQVVTYNFAPHKQIENADGFSELIIENCSYISEEGMPDIPVFGVDILLAPGHEITSILIQNIEFYPAIENISIRPAAAQFPISKGAPAEYKAMPNSNIYNLNQDFPENIIDGKNTSFLRGHAIGSFLIYPVIFNPILKRAVPIKSITLEIISQTTPRAEETLRFLRNDLQTKQRIKQTVENRDESIFNHYMSLREVNSSPNYDILVITKESFTSALCNFITHKNLWGYKVLVKTIEEIYQDYQGVDNAEKMRNCVMDAYENDGISYLMLFGDSHQSNSSTHNIIPYRKMYGQVQTSDGLEIDNLPSDMYFACFDHTWNCGDGTWGKPGYEDLGHEISVGRICADNAGEIETFVTKLINYQENPVVNDIKRAVMVGEELDPSTYGDDYKNHIANGGSSTYYTTVGIPSDFTITKLYEKGSNSWNVNTLLNHFNNQGVHMINHLGHSDVTYNMKLSNSDIKNANFTNNGTNRMLSIVYSQGCYNGSFDNVLSWGQPGNSDCINEMFHKINGGVVANIGNSRYGWYSQGNTNGASQRFDRYFFDGIFGKNIYTIGDVNSYSKDINKSYIKNNSALRWCCYELNLMGDPSMDIWTDIPTEFDFQFIDLVVESELEISVSTGVPYARVAILKDNELLSRGLCDNNGYVLLTFNEPVDYASVTLSISGHNKYRYEQHGLIFPETPPIRELNVLVEGNVITLDWKEPDYSDGNSPDTYVVYRNGNKIKTLSAEFLSYQDKEQLSWNTTYEYCVKAFYTFFASYPVCLSAETEPFCDIVGDLSSSVNEKTVTLRWKKPETFTPKNYIVFRDDEFLKETAGTTLFAVDKVPEDDTEYEYCVFVRYSGCDEPEPVCLKVVVGSPVSISDRQLDGFQIYPNPTTGKLIITNLSSDRNKLDKTNDELRITNVEVLDIYGKKLSYNFTPSSSNLQIDVSCLQNGFYFLRIYTDHNIYVKRFTVIR